MSANLREPLIGVATLPDEARLQSGLIFNPNDDIWRLSNGVTSTTLNFATLNLSLSMMVSFKTVLIWYLENHSLSHAKNLFERFLAFSRFLNREIDEVTAQDILNYKSSLPERSGWYVGALSGLFSRWRQMFLYGVSEDAAELLKDLKIKGNLKGEAVLTMNPLTGPFTELETQSIHRELASQLEKGMISDEDYCLAWLFLAFGMRPVQYAGMKVCDVWRATEKDGSEVFVVKIPRAKQRVNPRAQFLERKIPLRIGIILEKYIANVKSQFIGILSDINEAPLFPKRAKEFVKVPGFEYHPEAREISKTLNQVIDSLNVISERTGKRLNVSATRFRRTVGTRAAEEGHGALVIAEILDHKDTQNVGVYVEATPAIVDRIDKAIALKMAPFAQAFKGILVHSESEAKRGNDPTSRICGPKETGSFKPVGNCGTYGFCGLLAPISCYTCSNFQPWLDGPHEKVLEHLIGERDRLMDSSDSRIAAINDQTLLAVAQVVKLCTKRLGGKVE